MDDDIENLFEGAVFSEAREKHSVLPVQGAAWDPTPSEFPNLTRQYICDKYSKAIREESPTFSLLRDIAFSEKPGWDYKRWENNWGCKRRIK